MYPLKLIPVYKNYIWGGNRLEEIFGKHSGYEKTAESWELSCHKDGLSIIENGEFAAMTLQQVIEKNPDFVGNNKSYDGRFPILTKLIDAAKDLSIQVHPSDITADASKGESGKAEMWYVVKADSGSYIYYGLNQSVSKEKFTAMAKNGTVCDVLNKVYVNEGEVFFILPGTIHAIGKGCLIAEIQQSSNTTFRVFDYNRTDAKGNKRQLHLERAVEVIDYTPIIPDRTSNNNMISTDDFCFSNIFECRYFRVAKITCEKAITLNCSKKTFQALLFIDGYGKIVFEKKEYLFKKGDSFFIPAGMGSYNIIGKYTLLLSSM